MKSDKKQYKRKHKDGIVADPQIADAVSKKTVDGAMTCADAFSIASELQKPIMEVGTVLDLLEISITKCQLGLFGYSPKKSIVSPAQSIDDNLHEAIMRRLIDECLPCEAAWEIARASALPKMEVASVCEAMAIKIKPCQLGAF